MRPGSPLWGEGTQGRGIYIPSIPARHRAYFPHISPLKPTPTNIQPGRPTPVITFSFPIP